MTPVRTCQCGFLLVMLTGAGFLAIGLFVVPILPYFQLDVVLSPAELADARVCGSTLEMLKAAGGNLWLMWTVAGIVLASIGTIGFRASLRLHLDSSRDQND